MVASMKQYVVNTTKTQIGFANICKHRGRQQQIPHHGTLAESSADNKAITSLSSVSLFSMAVSDSVDLRLIMTDMQCSQTCHEVSRGVPYFSLAPSRTRLSPFKRLLASLLADQLFLVEL